MDTITRPETFTDALTRLIDELNSLESATEHAQIMRARGGVFDRWHLKKTGKKFAYLDCGTSGAFLVEVTTGELFNIQGYGVADYNKKKKADIGNVYTTHGDALHRQRYNYLR